MFLESQKSELVKEILNLLSNETQALNKNLIFIGGSAIQTLLKSKTRLSVDLDLYYDGNFEDLLIKLPAVYTVETRRGLQDRPFDYYKIKKGEISIKVDVMKIKNALIPVKVVKINAKPPFSTQVATPEYLLAAKLSALAIGTVGRLRDKLDFQTNLLKDIFDSNCLIGEYSVNKEVWTYFVEVVKQQNYINKTNYSSIEAIDSAISTALTQGNTKEKDNKNLKNTIRSFNATLGTSIDLWTYKTMAYRLATYLKIFKNHGENSSEYIAKIEKLIREKQTDRMTLLKCKNNLLKIKELDYIQIKEMTVAHAQTLLYVYAYYFDAINDL